MKKCILFAIFALVLCSCSNKSDKEASKPIDKPIIAKDTVAKHVSATAHDNSAVVHEDSTKSLTKPVAAKDEAVKHVSATAQAKTATAQTAKAIDIPQKAKPKNSKLSNLSKSELWAKYKQARKKAYEYNEKGMLKKAAKELLLSAECAELIDRQDIAAWQYNNVGKQEIDIFKSKTEYDKRMNRIGSMEYGDKKTEYIAKCKKVMSDNINILDRSLGYLEKAKDLDAIKTDNKRLKMIESNIRFIIQLKRFLEAVS